MNWINRLIRRLELFGRRMRFRVGSYECEQCGDEQCTEYEYPVYDDSGIADTTLLCDDCALGLFCLGCGSFTGGTEDIFRYGGHECSSCHSYYDDFDYQYHARYDDEADDWYDEDGEYTSSMTEEEYTCFMIGHEDFIEECTDGSKVALCMRCGKSWEVREEVESMTWKQIESGEIPF